MSCDFLLQVSQEATGVGIGTWLLPNIEKRLFLWAKSYSTSTYRSRQDANLRGENPMDFKSIALTTRPRLPSQHDEKQKQWIYNSLYKI